ncbi:hypothetical protein MSAN_01354800 [Mycena sanguinolenta]|uniref:Uncharacterized protein n=1 Tax=Mycena sanguinolenta TaxID=230812 RepID=A0A8H6YEN1_9AGAR|nr:hypothetical protein MSAN_01354800 [Mycena sanguinolenta]
MPHYGQSCIAIPFPHAPLSAPRHGPHPPSIEAPPTSSGIQALSALSPGSGTHPQHIHTTYTLARTPPDPTMASSAARASTPPRTVPGPRRMQHLHPQPMCTRALYDRAPRRTSATAASRQGIRRRIVS